MNHLKNERDEVIGAIETIHDITSQKEMEAVTLRMQKLESVGVLAGGIAHDFNNYLAALMSNIQLASLRLERGGEIKPLLKTTENILLQATGLTQQLLAFAKGGAPVKRITSFEDIIYETTGFVLRGTNVSCKHQIPQDLWLTQIDPGQITQVITNLIINALQVMPQGGQITITCENKIVESGESLSLKSGNYLKIYSIIHNHDGFIGFESTGKSGTAFYFYLPAIPESHHCHNDYHGNEICGKNE